MHDYIENEFKRCLMPLNTRATLGPAVEVSRAAYFAGAMAMFQLLIIDPPDVDKLLAIKSELEAYCAKIKARNAGS